MAVDGNRVFQMHACIGEGGFGEVYRATMRSPGGLEREVAVKTLRPAVAPDDDAVRRLRDEARLLARLEHRAILDVHDIVQLGGRVALVMKYLDGEDLGGCLQGRDPLSRRGSVEAVGEVASALAAAWGNLELVHRDIKPSNIRISTDGSVRLLDFGIARSPQVAREGHTTTGMVVGTPGYIAPERIAEAVDGPASDVYAVGCVLFACLARMPLFYQVPRPKMLGFALDQPAHDQFIRERLAGLPSGPDVELLRRLLAFAPADRPSAARVEELCEDIVAQLPGEPLRRWARRRVWAPPPEVAGDLVGQVLAEGASAVRHAESPTRPDPLPGPRVAEPAPPRVRPPPPGATPALAARPSSGERVVAPPGRAVGAEPRPGGRAAPPERVLGNRSDRAHDGGGAGMTVMLGFFAACVATAGAFYFAASEGLLGPQVLESLEQFRADLAGSMAETEPPP